MNDYIGHFGRRVQNDAKLRQVLGFQMNELVLSVANVEHHTTRREPRAELLDDGLDERILATGRKSHL